MWREIPITGASLPSRRLALTFDDGPGPSNTLEIAEFLAAESIPATFFVVGGQVRRYPAVLPRLAALGHSIGNHTLSHPHLTSSGMRDEGVVEEIASAAHLIAGEGGGARPYFRPPYGAWNRRLAHILNRSSALAESHIGPIGWDFGGQDQLFWRGGKSPQACADSYLREMEKKSGRGGIVLLHDHTADDPAIAERNRAAELVRILIPRLKERGFTFASLQEVSEIRAETVQSC